MSDNCKAEMVQITDSDPPQEQNSESEEDEEISFKIPVENEQKSILPDEPIPESGLTTMDADAEEKPPCTEIPAKKCLCACHENDKDCSFHQKISESIKFRELLLLHLEIIEEQNSRLQIREKQLHQLINENEQLNARLNRMERRVALKTRKHTDDTETDSVKSKASTQKRSLSLGSAEVAKKPKKTSTYGSAGTTVTSKQCKDNSTGLYLETNIDYMQLETYVALQATKELATKIKIPVPTWKDIPSEHLSRGHRPKTPDKGSAEGIEERTDNESYHRRHSKMEVDEIRRKRWDMQQIRQERIHETLRQRQRERDDSKQSKNAPETKEKKLQCLHPSCDNVMAIEVMSEVPVFALGARVPQFEQSEFDLPWFDVAKREVQDRQRKAKLAARHNQRRKTWYKY